MPVDVLGAHMHQHTFRQPYEMRTRMPHKVAVDFCCLHFVCAGIAIFACGRSINLWSEWRAVSEIANKSGEKAGMPEVSRSETRIFVNISLLRAFTFDLHYIRHTTKTILCIASRMKIFLLGMCSSSIVSHAHTQTRAIWPCSSNI